MENRMYRLSRNNKLHQRRHDNNDKNKMDRIMLKHDRRKND